MTFDTRHLLHGLSRGALLVPCLVLASCGSNENSHTTATTYLPPPPHQVLTVVSQPPAEMITKTQDMLHKGLPTPADLAASPKEPLLYFPSQDQKLFRVGEEVPIVFFVANAKLRGDGGEYRVRYIVDDEEMKWIDKAEPFWIAGWTPGKHTIRLELIGPDGWPYRNNVVTREIEVGK